MALAIESRTGSIARTFSSIASLEEAFAEAEGARETDCEGLGEGMAAEEVTVTCGFGIQAHNIRTRLREKAARAILCFIFSTSVN